MRNEDLARWCRSDRDVWTDADHAAFDAAFDALRASLGGDRPGHADARFETHAAWNPEVVIGRFPDDGPAGLDAAVATAAAAPDVSADGCTERVDGVACVVRERCWPLVAAVVAECAINRYDAAAEVAEGLTALATPSEDPAGRVVVAGSGPGDAVSGLLAGVSVALRAGRPVVLAPDPRAALVGELVHRCVVDGAASGDACHLVQGVTDLRAHAFGDGVSLRTPPTQPPGGCAMTIGPDDDLDAACETAFTGIYAHGGQRATSLRRLVIDPGIKETFMNLFMMRVMSAITDHPWLADVDVGPTRDAATAERVASAAQALHPDRVLCGGEVLGDAAYTGGHYLLPTVLDGLPADHELVVAPSSGPVVVLQ